MVGRRPDNGEIIIRIDPRYYRPTEVETLLGDASKARKNWMGPKNYFRRNDPRNDKL